jgi:predicted phage tail protein
MVRLVVAKVLLRLLAQDVDNEFEARVGTVQELIRFMEAKLPGFRDTIFDEMDRPRRYVNMFLNGKNIAQLNDPMQVSLQSQDTVWILPSIAGGGKL